MKITALKILFAIIVTGGLGLLAFTGCKKAKTDITAVITVKYQADTNVIVPFANVVIGRDFDDVKVEGLTDATGQFTTTFKLEAILDVVASKDTNSGSGTLDPVLTGLAVIRLKPGETAYKTVFIR
jgi:hypothetical protein